VSSTNHEAPHCAIFSSLLLLPDFQDTTPAPAKCSRTLHLTSSKQLVTYLITGGKAGDLQMYLCPHLWLLSNVTNLIGPASLGRI